MFLKSWRSYLVTLTLALAAFALPPACTAQPATARPDLLTLVPPDVGFCLLVNDLRGHAEKWERSAWLRSFQQSPLVKTLLESPEVRQLATFEAELKKHLDVDARVLRDDIFGDAFLIAYRPGTPERPDQEQGMIALRALRPELLAKLVDRFNRLQKATGELKELREVQYRGATYFRRVQADKTHYYYLHGPLFVAAGNEAMMRQVIERDRAAPAEANPWPARFQRAGADRVLLTLGVNPRAFALFPAHAKGEQPHGIPQFWQALDGVFVTLGTDAGLELQLTLQGRAADMPESMRPLFTATGAPSVLWQRFPSRAILTIANRTDFANVAQQLLELVPAAERRKLTEGLQGGLGLLTRLDLLREVLPNVGPDWGLCVLPPVDGAILPDAIAAVAVKPGSGPEAVDAMLLKGIQLVAGLVVADHNAKNPALPIRVETEQQGKVTVRFLRQDQLFPSGFRPAAALKEGFLLLATSPGVIARFQPHVTATASHDEALLLKLSPTELALMLRGRRDPLLRTLQQKHQLSSADAAQRLDQLLELLELFDSVTLSQRGAANQASWALRIVPRSRP